MIEGVINEHLSIVENMKKNCIKFIVTVLLFILLIVSIFSYFNFYKNSQELYLKTNPHSIILDKVDLPVAEGPIIANISPGSTLNDIPFKIY